MTSPLSLEQAPPLSVPLRFFLTGPLFGVAAGLVVALHPDAVMASRWALPAVAALHLVTAGFMLQVMVGALLQFMPVAAGANVWRPRLVGGAVHVGLLLGAAALASGFLGAGGWAFQGAAVCLGAATLFGGGVLAVGLLRSEAIGPTLAALKLAVLGLVVTVGLGVALATALGWALPLQLVDVAHVHAAWGVLGWGLTLLAGVAYLVVPMFQLTPPYPTRLARALPVSLLAAAALWTLALAVSSAWLAWAAFALGAAGAGTFAVKTLRLQARRRRKVLDATFRAWRLGLACLLGAVAVATAARVWPQGLVRDRLELLAGVWLFAGAFPAVINGMLYKIVPFLDWLHLQRVMPSAPTMQKVIPDAWARWQLRLFVAALVALTAAVFVPVVAVLGGGLFAAACLALEVHLVRATLLFLRLSKEAKQPGAPARHTASV